MAHDLRNQLTIVMACADLIASIVPKGVLEKEIANLVESTDRASRLLSEFLREDPWPGIRGCVDLNEIVGSAANILALCAGEKIRLHVVLSPTAVPVDAQAAELDRILMNLVLNARDAMADGGDLSIETAVTVFPPHLDDDGNSPDAPLPPSLGTARGGLAYARLTVTDTGCGMTAAVKSHIFEPFFTTKATGAGLGLSSVAFTAQQLHGMVSVESEPGRGTSVTVILPVAAGSTI